jgi:hypothetical protein
MTTRIAERLIAALEPASRTALLVCLRVLERSACKYAVAGELALRLRGVGQGRAGRVGPFACAAFFTRLL